MMGTVMGQRMEIQYYLINSINYGGQGARLLDVATRGRAQQYAVYSKTYYFIGVATSCDLRQCDATVMMGV